MKTKTIIPTLYWSDREETVKPVSRVSYCSLEADMNYSYGDDSSNMLIQGDNLEALKALLPDYTSKVKCIYIDPPYNTGNDFEHYNDSLKHSKWLDMMYLRLELLRELLATDVSIWISIDANEVHYLKVICDEIFGRKNFVNEIVWQRSYAPVNFRKNLSRSHDTILVYAKDAKSLKLNRFSRDDRANRRYKNLDDDLRGAWQASNISIGSTKKSNIYEITIPSGRKVLPPLGRSWLISQEKYQEMRRDNRIWFGRDGNSAPKIKRFLSEVKDGVIAMTWWSHQEVSHNSNAKLEVKALNLGEVFGTPKPEKLIHRILTLATNEGDLVLDSFLGSGTTAAVAHKMERRYIGIEMGNHAKTHCAVRLQKVIDGEQGGISKEVNWQGGGGYRFFTLKETIDINPVESVQDTRCTHLATQ